MQAQTTGTRRPDARLDRAGRSQSEDLARPAGRDDACTAGWRWTDDTHRQVEFCGTACDELKSGDVTSIQARFGCATVLIWRGG